MEYVAIIASVLLGYLLGCISPSSIFARLKGIDIRAVGSNNPGASNATIAMGWKIGVLVGAIDILKAVVSVLAARALFPDSPIAPFAAGAACVLGHIFPVTMRFKGGKGFASFLGMCLALDWRFFLILGVGIIIITVVTDYIALATFATVITEPIFVGFTTGSLILTGIVCIASIVIIIRHFENIRRLASGEEIGLRKAFGKKEK